MQALIFFSVIGLANYFVVAGLFEFAPIAPQPFWVTFTVAAALFAIEMLDLRTAFFQSSRLITFALSIVTGTFLSLVFYVFVADIIVLIALMFSDISADILHHDIFWTIICLTAVSVSIGVMQAMAGPKLKTADVVVKNLPPAFENYKIVQVSDLHVGGTIRKAYVQNVVDIVNKTDADLIALTGDFADGEVEELKDDSELLGHMKSKDGMYFITGNHEYYHGLGKWLPFYKSLGIHILSNRHEIIKRGEDKLAIAGVTDYSTRYFKSAERSDIQAAARDIPNDAVKILLMHQPTQYKDAEAAGFDLQLSGHTHGGQFFPWTLVIPFFHAFYKGLGRYKDMNIYVSVGTGYWGPCLRTFMPSEITVLTLKRG